MSKQVWLLAGGNGAGKSTFYRKFIEPKEVAFINVDQIAKSMNPANPGSVSYEASRKAQSRVQSYLAKGWPFCFETVFSHVSKISLIQDAKSRGYEVILVYICLAQADLNEARVAQRVSEGGHAVPPEKIRTRLIRTAANLAVASQYVDSLLLFDNSSMDDPFKLVARKQGSIVTLGDDIGLPDWAQTILFTDTNNSNVE